MLRLQNIEKTYKGRGVATEVLKDVSLTIGQGEFVCLVGRSGSGKTTLLNIIGLMDAATGGQYYFQNRAVADLSQNARAAIRNREIGYVFQAFHLISELNVLDNVTLPMGYGGVCAQKRKQRGKELLELVGMAHREKYRPAELSGGEKQRVAIARALSNRPQLILADEPTGNLDSQNAQEIMGILKKLHQEGITVIMVTHNMELTAGCTALYTLNDGKLAR